MSPFSLAGAESIVNPLILDQDCGGTLCHPDEVIYTEAGLGVVSSSEAPVNFWCGEEACSFQFDFVCGRGLLFRIGGKRRLATDKRRFSHKEAKIRKCR